ncbi:MFS transporter [Vibrio spartinae]|uniref:Inner membrane transport protein YnfM n=1 Tax=Vibrio spartinae TaxID=1918945 RepID=A0A1N6M7L9_9VIBR|nr:MFS transporter [Vibrio spartinae]QMV14137.1 Inner membrane transport protein YnfM [Vibrio spartinae]SIO95414.1 Inner membrane transport protein YnfM [Vibrio spartinae]
MKTSNTFGERKVNKSYIAVTFALALSGLSELASIYFVQPLLPFLSDKYHIPVDHVSIILSVEMALLAIGLLFTGSLSDRFGRKKLIVTSLFSGAILTCCCSFITSWNVLVAVMGLLGLTLSGIAAAATAYISEEVAPAVAGIVTGYFVFGNSMGGMSGRVFASQMIEHTTLHNIFYGFSILLLCVSVLVLVTLPESKNFKPTPKLNLSRMINGMGEHFRNKMISPVYCLGFIMFGSFASLYNYLTFYVSHKPFNLTHAQAGLISVCFILSVITAPQAGRLANKFGATKVLTGLFSVMIVGMLLALTHTLTSLLIGVVIFTSCFFGCHSVCLRWVNKNATHNRGQATSLYLFCYYLGGSILGYCNGYVYTYFGWAGMATFVIALLCIGICIATYLKAQIQRNETLIAVRS